MSSVSVVGVDLGTTNTVVGCVRAGKVHILADEGGRRLLPSVVSFHPNGDVLVGEAAKARKSLAEATRKSLELELQLSTRRGERELAGAGDAAVALRHDNVIRDLERKVLEAQRVQADREKQVAERHQDITRRRLELYQAQGAAGGN